MLNIYRDMPPFRSLRTLMWIFVLAVWTSIFLGWPIDAQGSNVSSIHMISEAKLRDFLKKNYQVVGDLSRPVWNASQTINVKLQFNLLRFDYDDTKGVFSTIAQRRCEWKDEFLTWNPASFAGISQVHLRPQSVWVPDIAAFNRIAQFRREERPETPVETLEVRSDGQIVWLPLLVFHTACASDMTSFPFDKHTCEVVLGSWAYRPNQLKLESLQNKLGMNLSYIYRSDDWKIVDTSGKMVSAERSELRLSLTFHRRSAFHTQVILVPTILLGFIAVAHFWVPFDQSERIGLASGTTSAFMVLLLVVIGVMPQSSSSDLGKFLCAEVVLAMLSVLEAIFVRWIATIPSDPPKWIKRVFNDCLARFLHLNPRKHKQNNRSLEMNEDKKTEENKPLTKAAKDDENKNPWKTVAYVIDRISFIVYFVCLILALIILFPRPS